MHRSQHVKTARYRHSQRNMFQRDMLQREMGHVTGSTVCSRDAIVTSHVT